MSSANASTAADHTNRHEEYGVGHQVGPGVHHDKHLDFFHKGENSHKGECHHQLSSQHQEHLEGRADYEAAGIDNMSNKGCLFFGRISSCIKVISSKTGVMF